MNIYQQNFKYNQEWLQKYIDLVLKGWSREYKTKTLNPNEYYENHHIIPKCWTQDHRKVNFVRLEGREHIMAHYYLMKAFPEDRKLVHACWNMFNRKELDKILLEIDIEIYHESRAAHAENVRLRQIGKTWEELYGKEHSDKRKAKISKAGKGRPGLKGEKNPMFGKSPWSKGVKFSDIHKLNISKARKNKSWEDLHGQEKAKQLKADQSIRTAKRNKERAIPVHCVELDITFRSCQDAAKYLDIKYPGEILKGCKSPDYKRYGYHWRFA